MGQQPLRAAVIGCGKIGSEFADDPRVKGVYSHAGAYRASARAELVAVCDLDSERAARAARRWGLARAYSDVNELLATERPQLVSICTPDASHASVLRTVLDSPGVRGILAEKPLALDPLDARAIVGRARDAGICLLVNYIRRFASGHELVRNDIASGALGPIRSITGAYSGGLVHNGSHWIDLMRWLIGEISEVRALESPGNHAQDTPHVVLRFATGVTAFLQGCAATDFGIFEFDVIGERGRRRGVDSGHHIESFGSGENPFYSGYRSLLKQQTIAGGIEDAMCNAVENLIDSVLLGTAPKCTGDDGARALEIAHDALRSLRSPAAIGRSGER